MLNLSTRNDAKGLPRLFDRVHRAVITKHESSVIEHDGPASAMGGSLAVNYYLFTGQVAEVLHDDASFGRRVSGFDATTYRDAARRIAHACAPINGIKPKLNACDRETLERAAFVVKPVERFAAPFSGPCQGFRAGPSVVR